MGNGRLIVVGILFLASLLALLASAGFALRSETNELAVRDQISNAAIQLADTASESVAELPTGEPNGVLPDQQNRRLAAIVNRVLADYPDAEGGFYLGGSDQFAGVSAAIPQPEPTFEKPPLDKGKKGKVGDKKADKMKADRKESEKAISATGRRDPPPLETESIRQQARSSTDQEQTGKPLVQVRDIGPSRVAIATMAIGDDRPARAVAWVMVRLAGPEQQKARLGNLQLATGVSLVGIMLALGLAVGLVRSLRRETHRREELRDELRKSEYLASLGRLLAGVAHEVRNPLAAISSTVQLWERLPDQSRTPESLAAVASAVNRLNWLVGRLLLFARAGHENRRQVDLNKITAETLHLILARADTQGIEIEADLRSNLPFVLGASQALGQIVLNLVTNALQEMPNGGKLICRTQLQSGDRVELQVSDTGPGVDANVRDRIFEPFFTTRPDGTGLGLALCRELARQHGGDVTLDPEVTSGATFHLTLPIACGDCA